MYATVTAIEVQTSHAPDVLATQGPLGPPRVGFRGLIVCAVIFAALVSSVIVFRYSGDGDSILHYLNARDARINPGAALHAWARPVFKLLIAIPASHGVLAARCWMALLSTFAVWQTMQLASRLGMARPDLAGLMLIGQPLVFSLASDTMSEMPMALGIVVALRLWLSGWHFASCLIIGFLPAVRPEGFFLGVVWGLLVLFDRSAGRVSRRAMMLPVLAIGMGCWVLACKVWTGDPIWFITIWNWPVKSYEVYGHGSIFHYLINWPGYCGPVLLALFIAGVSPAMRRKGIQLPLTVLGLIFLVHTILYWRGWFASCGLVRIMAITSPITALVCLEGWNALRKRLQDKGWPVAKMRSLAWGLGTGAAAWAITLQAGDSGHSEGAVMRRCTQYIRDHQLFQPGDWIFAGNQIVAADMDLPPLYKNQMDTPCDSVQIRKNLAALPIGTIGVWDNQQARVWHGITIDEMGASGFTVLYEARERAHVMRGLLLPGWPADFRYAVLRKDRPFSATQPSKP